MRFVRSQGRGFAAFEAAVDIVDRAAVGTNAAGAEHVEGGAASPANPEISHGRRIFTLGAGQAGAFGRGGNDIHGARLL